MRHLLYACLASLGVLASCGTPPPALNPTPVTTPTRSLVDTGTASPAILITSPTVAVSPVPPTLARVASLTRARTAVPNTRAQTARPSVTPASALNRTNRLFDTLVMVDALAPQTLRANVERVFNLASSTLAGKTGQWMRLVDIVYGIPRGKNIQEMVNGYLNSHPSNPPDAVLVLSNDPTAHSYGGYSFVLKPNFAFSNEFPSPRAEVAGDSIYIAVVEFDHPYARCGYDDSGNHISGVSVDGECRNQPGTQCVQKASRWMCANALNDLYANADYFAATTIVHEFLHPFGIDANESLDHYGTPTCIRRTGMTQAAALDTVLAQQNAGLCPDVFARFHR